MLLSCSLGSSCSFACSTSWPMSLKSPPVYLVTQPSPDCHSNSRWPWRASWSAHPHKLAYHMELNNTLPCGYFMQAEQKSLFLLRVSLDPVTFLGTEATYPLPHSRPFPGLTEVVTTQDTQQQHLYCHQPYQQSCNSRYIYSSLQNRKVILLLCGYWSCRLI